MTKKFTLGILVTGPLHEELSETYGEYDTIFTRFFNDDEWDVKGYRVLENIFPQSVNDADGWLISGSRYGVYETHDWLNPLENFIREAHQKNVPMVGICFGHQIMAQAMGGKVEPFSKGWAVGKKTYQTATDEFAILSWHQDQIIEKPENATVIAHNDFCQYAGLIYDDWGLSFQGHPEFTTEFFTDLLELREDILPPEIAKQAWAIPLDNLSSKHIATQIKSFLENRNINL